MVNRTVVGVNQIPILRRTLQGKKQSLDYNYLITEREVATGKSRTSAYRIITRSIQQGLSLRFSHNDLTLGY